MEKFSEIKKPEIEFLEFLPEQEKSPVPIFFGPGWGNNAETTPEILKPLAEEMGRRTLSLIHSRKKESPEIREKAAKLGWPAVETRKAADILEVLEEKGIKMTDAVAYSEGGINMTLAALMEPERFRNIVYVCPGGMVEKNSFLQIAPRFARELARGLADLLKNKENSLITKYFKDLFVRHIGKNPVMSVREGDAISRTEIHGMLRQLHEKGVGLAFVCGVDDGVFSMDRIQKKAGEQSLGDYVDGFYSTKNAHWGIFNDKVRGAIEHALEHLARKKQRPESVDKQEPEAAK